MGPIANWAAAYQPQIWSIALVIIGALVSRAMRLRPKLHYSVHHATNLLVDQPLFDQEGKQVSARQLVRTASIVVSNGGLNPAKNAEISFNWKPMILNVLPARSYSDVQSPFDRYSVKFDSMAPGEQVTIDIMSINAELPVLTAVRCDECEGKLINMAPQRVWPSWFNYSASGFFLLGLGTAFYLVIIALQNVGR
jgi:hypothetical protein